MQQSFTIERLLVYWFFLLAGIVQTAPGFSQGYVDDGKRYAMYTVYHHGDVDGSMQDRQIRGMKDAFANGCNSVVIGISWGTLQPSLNSAPNWAYIDRFIQVAQQYNAKIALRLRTLRKDRVGYWPEEQSMKDTQGNIMQLEGETHPRFGYTPAIDKAQDFIRAATQRYKYLNDRGELLFMSITFNPQWENEYWFTSFPEQTRTSFDFNELTIGDFQRWSLAKYGSMDALNRNWGTNYRTATDIRPTYPNSELRGGYQGNRGADWYTFRHVQFKSFNDRFATTVKSVDPTIRIVTEQGSVYDIISANRGTLAFKNMAELFDGIKVNDGLEYIHQFSTDLLRSNVKPGGWVLNELDGSTFLSDHLDRSAEQAVMAENLFKYGAKIITFANFFIDANHDYLRAILDKIKAKGLLNQPVPTVTPVATMTYKLSTLVQSNVYESGILGQWNTLRGGNDGKPVRILIDEDLLTGVTTPPLNQPPTVANQVPDQTTVVNRSFSFKIPDNTFADADGQITSVTLSGLPTGLTYDAATRTISGTPVSIGSNEITVRATDNSNATVIDSFTLTVRRSTLPLQLLDPTVDCVTGRFEFRSTEGDGSAVEYAIDNLYSWSTQTVYTLAESLRSGSSLTIRARQSGTELALNYRTTCPTSTSGSNKPPVVNIQLADQSTVAGRPFLITLPANVFTDPDGQIVSVSLSGLPAGITYTPSTRVIEGTPANAGVWTVTATATDDKGATTSTTFRFTVEGTSTGRPLRLLDPLVDCSTGRFEFRSADGDGTPIEYAADDLYSYNTRTVYTLAEQFRNGTRITLRARQSGVSYIAYYSTICAGVNRVPVVNAPIANQSGTVSKTVSVLIPAGTFTDSDGQIVSVSLSGLPTGLSYDPATRLITGTVSTTGVWTITVTATDDKGASTSTTFTITIGRDIKPLRLLQPVMNCTTGLFEFRSADGDGTPIEYSIDRVVNWSTQTSFVVPLSARYNEQFDIKARQSGQVYASVYYAGCKASNQFPTVRTPIANQTLTQFQSMSLVIPASTFADADGTISSVSLMGLPPGLTYAANTLTLSGTPTAAGSWTVIATAMDNQGASVSTTFVITVILQVKALRLLDPLVDCSTGRFEFRSADGDGTPIEYAADDLFSYNTRTVYTLAEQFRSGTRITLMARQSGVSYIAYYTTSCIFVGNRPPVVSMPIANQSAVVNKPVSILIPAGTFTDADGSVVLVSVTGLPPGLSYDTATRLITGTVSTTNLWTSTVTATDDKGATTSTTFTITIGRDVKLLRLLDPILNCDTGLFEFRSADGDGTPIEYSIDRVVDWSTQSSFIMAVGPRYNEQLDIKARQSGQVYASVYRPACPPPNQLPTVKAIIPNQTLTQFRNMSLEIPAGTFTDADGIIVLVSMTGLPPGLTYAANTATLSGAPTAAGSWTVTVTASDDRSGKVSTTFVITVLPQVKPLRLLAPIIDCVTGRLEFQTADGDGTAIGYSIDQLLDWTSQSVYTLAEGPRYGTVLTLRIRQSGVEQTLAFTTPCQRSNKPPVVANRIADQVLIVNQPASVTLPANTFVDPDGTITSVTLTGLPVGISYDPTKRAIQGTPTLIGTSPAIAKATDNAGASVSDTFLITVRVATRFAVTTTLLDVQGRVLKDIVDADLLDSKKMPLLANLSCQPKVAAGSVLMELTGKAKRTVYANAAPYLLYASGQGFKPEVGSYQFKVSVFSGVNGTGTLLGTSIVRFDIIIANEGG